VACSQKRRQRAKPDVRAFAGGLFGLQTHPFVRGAQSLRTFRQSGALLFRQFRLKHADDACRLTTLGSDKVTPNTQC